MLRFLFVSLLALWIPVFGTAHQDVRALKVEELGIEVGADNNYRGTLRISIAEGTPMPVSGRVRLPFAVSDIIAEPGNGVVVKAVPTDPGDLSQTRLSISVNEPGIADLVIRFAILPLERSSDNPLDSDALASPQDSGATAYFLVRENTGMGGGLQYKLHLRLPYPQPAASDELIPAQVAVRLGEGVKLVEVSAGRPAGVRSEPLRGPGVIVEATFFESGSLRVSYELPVGDLAKAGRTILLALLVVCATLVPFMLVTLNSLIASSNWRTGAALGVWALAELSSLAPAKVMDPNNRPVVWITGIVALLLIILFLLYGVRRPVAEVEELPGDLPLVSLEELQKLRRRYQGRLARLENQREGGGLQVPLPANGIQQLRDRIRAIDGEFAQREQPTLAWNTSAIRDLLTAAFNDEEITTFCFDHYRSVFDSSGGGMGKVQKIQLLLEHCIRHEQVQELLDAVKNANPVQFQRFEGRLKR